jgi:hypothetical protein
MGSNGKGGSSGPKNPVLVIPYYPNDGGHRPLASSSPFWKCDAIKLNGIPYAGELLEVGAQIEISVDVVNRGAQIPPPLTTSLFYWANPTTNFTSSTCTFIGASAPAPLSTSQITPLAPVTWSVPAGTPKHICLLAEVTTVLDPAQQTYNAAADRHWGQQNVYVMTVSAGGEIRVGFDMANGGTTASRFHLEVTHILVNQRALRNIVPKDTVLGEAEEITLTRTLSKEVGGPHSLHAHLAANEVLSVELRALVPRDATPGSTIVLQVAQFEHQKNQAVGGLGIVVHVK